MNKQHINRKNRQIYFKKIPNCLDTKCLAHKSLAHTLLWLLRLVREAFKKKTLNPWACPYLGGGGVPGSSAHTSLAFFFAWSKPTYLAQDVPKHILCSLLTQYFIYFLIYFTIKINSLTFYSSIFFRIVLIKNNPKFYKTCFTAYQTTPIIQKKKHSKKT